MYIYVLTALWQDLVTSQTLISHFYFTNRFIFREIYCFYGCLCELNVFDLQRCWESKMYRIYYLFSGTIENIHYLQDGFTIIGRCSLIEVTLCRYASMHRLLHKKNGEPLRSYRVSIIRISYHYKYAYLVVYIV